MKNLLSYLAFDRSSMETLLSPESAEYVEAGYPLFFKHSDHRSAIDLALSRNQINSLQLMINHITKY